MFNVPDSLYRLENITLIVWDVMSLQKLQIFALKRLSAMMRGLTTNIYLTTRSRCEWETENAP